MTQRARKRIRAWEPKPAFLPEFGTGEVAQILGIPIWRLQKFLDVKSYPLSPTGQIGKGKGSRRTFVAIEIYRLAAAVRMAQHGFSPSCIAEALQFVEDNDLLSVGTDGQIISGGIAFRLTKDGQRQFKVAPPGAGVRMKTQDGVYYVLDFAELVTAVDSRIRELNSTP